MAAVAWLLAGNRRRGLEKGAPAGEMACRAQAYHGRRRITQGRAG